VADPALILNQPEVQASAPDEQVEEGFVSTSSQVRVPLLDKLLVTRHELAALTTLSVRHLARLDAMGELPGRVGSGRAVRYSVEIIKQWIDCGCDYRRWKALYGRRVK
jgi:hypothetical protein